jgi:hypothetical protein
MVDVKTETKKTDAKPKREDPRASLREARRRRLRVISEGKNATVKVYAANETMRRVMRHANGTPFRETLDQPVEWPNDSFTARRIAEGSVLTEGAGSSDEVEVDESLNAREQSAANKTTKEQPKNGSKPAKPHHQPEPSHPAA